LSTALPTLPRGPSRGDVLVIDGDGRIVGILGEAENRNT
jgi:hypothetical protein